MRKRLLILPFAVLFITGCSGARPDRPSRGPGLTYRELLVKDYDEMSAMVRKHTQSAHKTIRNSDNEPEWQTIARQELLRAERVILSRPNSDNMVTKLTPDVRREITLFASYDDILEAMTEEAILAFDKKMNLSTEMMTTYMFVLENLMSELKPEVQNERPRAMLARIRDAKIKIPIDVIAERKLQGMFLTESPSDYAARILIDAGFGKKNRRR